ncbi:hypothetical protein KBY91_31850 [Streptomyces sp. RK23]|uniref:hypothetical protein n=1 Tax=unclassified Streptomyces TaxID=2593676 RepID=UPI001B38239D|nr:MULTISPECIES: hypothetical protein [unclassified Streptomyces]MBQ0967461.1 hypothetical protein [Streptomyces sp. RK74B]MBQ1008008.1 hypothetical protein [Streptomyces sp. RK23]
MSDALMEIVAPPPKRGTATVVTYRAEDDYVGSDSVTWSVRLDGVPETAIGVLHVEVEAEPEGEAWVPPGEKSAGRVRELCPGASSKARFRQGGRAWFARLGSMPTETVSVAMREDEVSHPRSA